MLYPIELLAHIINNLRDFPSKFTPGLEEIVEPRFEQFIRERQNLTNVTPATVEWYRRCLSWLPSESPAQADLKNLVLRMRQKCLKETGVNTVIRCANAYLHWNGGSERKCGPGCTHPRIAQLKEPRLVLPTFTEQQVDRLISWKPTGKYQRRLHVLILFLLDTGCRISEAIGLNVSEIDFDNLLITLDGERRKQRVVPISFELRKARFRYCKENGRKPEAQLFASRTGANWNRRNILRDAKLLCRKLGFDAPTRTLHSFRHTFAVNYLRRGGSVFHLQKVLGHSTLEMTRPAAASLHEGLEEYFTIDRLGVPPILQRCLATTDIIESPHAGVRIRTRRVTNWQNGTMARRWMASALLRTEKKFRRIMGYKELWALERF
ncbi:MAG: site-specific integrase [Terracidiphilus sp.]